MEICSTRKTARIGKRIAGIALAGVLACSLTPGLALADLGAGSTSAPVEQAAKKASKQKTKTVYVLVKSKSVVDGEYGQTTTTTYTTDAKTGLLKQKVDTTKGKYMDSTDTTSWTYDKNNNLKSKTVSTIGQTVKAKYAVASNGLLKRDSQKASSIGAFPSYKSTYTAKGGKIVKVKRNSTNGWGTITFKMAYKGGKVVKISNSKYKPSGYKYDKKGNIVKMYVHKGDQRVYINYKNYYKNGNLVKSKNRPQTDYGVLTTTTYKYKAVKVPASLVKKVKAQQWSLRNGDLNFALGTWAA